MSRPGTGPMQFGDDWPGVFIRGDDARRFAHAIRHFEANESPNRVNPIFELADLLESCNQRNKPTTGHWRDAGGGFVPEDPAAYGL